ncbi:MAG TPA: helix-turn-helix transcriptional regulator [Ktedonobacterales bacterium]|nr:helix-turn-helix transcriptional regulator [Ktedonobacterales bacterium]
MSAMNLMSEERRSVPATSSRLRVPYLRAWRLYRLLTQEQVVAASGVSVATIVRGEKGELVSALSAAKMARALGVTVEQLQSEKPS